MSRFEQNVLIVIVPVPGLEPRRLNVFSPRSLRCAEWTSKGQTFVCDDKARQ